MLTEDEVAILRLAIQRNPNPQYMKDMRESDEVARAEIELLAPTLRAEAQGKVDEAVKAQETVDLIELARPEAIIKGIV